MAQFQTADGRWLVGNVEGISEYSGFLGWRDCVIQLTANGATEQSVKYLEALRDYAFNRNSLGEPIAPPSVNVWVSNNGKTVAVQADDYAVDGNTFTICGIKWTGSAWDYTNAGQGGGGGGGGGGVLAVTATNGTLDKTWQEIRNATFSVLEMADEQYLQIGCVEDEGNYIVSYWTFGMTEPLLFIADSADGYPSVQ